MLGLILLFSLQWCHFRIETIKHLLIQVPKSQFWCHGNTPAQCFLGRVMPCFRPQVVLCQGFTRQAGCPIGSLCSELGCRACWLLTCSPKLSQVYVPYTRCQTGCLCMMFLQRQTRMLQIFDHCHGNHQQNQ